MQQRTVLLMKAGIARMLRPHETDCLVLFLPVLLFRVGLFFLLLLQLLFVCFFRLLCLLLFRCLLARVDRLPLSQRLVTASLDAHIRQVERSQHG